MFDARRDTYAELHDQGSSAATIAELVGTSKKGVHKALARKGYGYKQGGATYTR